MLALFESFFIAHCLVSVFFSCSIQLRAFNAYVILCENKQKKDEVGDNSKVGHK